MNHQRKIIHVDMDAFYASVEQRDHPDYRGQPLVVGGSLNERGVVAAASYEARIYGIHSAMPSRVAQAKCPHLIFVKPRFEVYRAISNQIHAIFEYYTDFVEPIALDEAYLDVTKNKQNIPYASTIARHIKATILESTGLTSRTKVAAWRFKPCWYAVSTQDRTTAPELQRFMANRMKANTIELKTSHLSIITHPQEIARLILNAAGRFDQ